MATADTSEIVYTFLPSDWEYPGSGTPSNLHWQPAQTCSAAAPESPSKALAARYCRWPGCQRQFARKQELERHTSSLHLPCSICCPHPSCPWRGTRKDELIKHMDKGQCGKEAKLDPGLYKIFDAKWILDWIYEDSSTETLVNFNLSVVLTYVRDSVEERAMELRKTELWGDAWGRQPKGRLG